jgi:hypothetical protein
MNSLKLRLSQAGTGYSAQLFRLTEGEWHEIASEPGVVLGFDPSEVRQLVLDERGVSPNFREMREKIGSFLLPGSVFDVWKRQPRANRTYLEIEPRELALVPWEIAYRGGDLFLDPKRTIVRAPGLTLDARTDEVWPVRLLVVLGSTDSAIAAGAEAAAIRSALRPMDRTFYLKQLLLPDRKELGTCLTEFRPHILHFIGHADERRGTAQLRFVLSNGKTWPWTTDDIRNDLRDAGWAPNFAYLNACRTYSAGATATGADTLAQMLLDGGAGAVLAMQADVVGTTSGLCAAALYKQIGAGAPLDEALARAQIAVSREVPGATGTREPFMGALTVSRPSEQVLSIRFSNGDAAKAVEQCTPLNDIIKVFVDRAEQCTNLIHSFYPIRQEEIEPYSLALVHGDSEVGKSWIAHWCMDACARHRHQVRYIEIVRACADWLTVLRGIRSGDPSRKMLCIHKPLDEAAFGLFNWELNRRLEGVVDPEPALAPAFENDALRPLGDEFSDTMISRTFASFRDAIQEAARQMPLLLVLDHFSNERGALPAGHFRYLWEYLISPIGAGEVNNVKMVVVLSKREKEQDYENLADFGRNYAEVPIGNLAPAHFFELGKELFSLLYPARSPDLAEPLLKYAQQELRGEWSLSLLVKRCHEINAMFANLSNISGRP